MGIEKSQSGKHTIYQDPTLKGKNTLVGFNVSSLLDAGYVFAPYIPLMATPMNMFPSQEQIKEETRVPIKIIKAVLKKAGYKINKDFKVERSKFSSTVIVATIVGRRFDKRGQCIVSTMRKGKLSITWTYDPSWPMGGKDSKNVDITLADPGCFQQISDTIIAAVKENSHNSLNTNHGYSKRVNASYYGKVTL